MFFVILALPYMQHRFGFITSGPLGGYFTNAPDVNFTFKGWFDGSYQSGINDYYNDHIGFREDLVRLNGQVDYTLFRKLDYGGTTLGYGNYMFFTEYIDAYYGRDYAGGEVLYEKMRKLKCLQDTLKNRGKTLLLVYASCKAWYCREQIPYFAGIAKRGDNNYTTLRSIGDTLGVNQVDINSWFLSLKKTTKELLYSHQGIHWTNYGAILAWDTIETRLEQLSGFKMLHPKWEKVVHTTEALIPDNDMGNIANLIFKVSKDTFCYPELYYNKDTSIAKPSCIFIGDSYVINLYRMGLIQNSTSGNQFWFYFRSVVHDTDYMGGDYIKVANYDWKRELEGADLVVLLYTPMNAGHLGDGFIEQAYDHYFGNK